MRAAAACLVMAVALVGCSDDRSSDAGGETTSTEATTADTTTTAEPRTSTTVAPTTSTTATTSPPTTSPPTTTTTAAPVTSRCQTVAFTPASEDAASDVTATGLACDEAEAFVRLAGARTSSGGPPELDVEGWHCVRTGSEEDPLPQASYECRSGARIVTFVRS